MSRRRSSSLARSVAVAALLHAGAAAAQGLEEPPPQDADRFFFQPIESEEELEDTSVRGSITSSTFLYRETGGVGTGFTGSAEQPESASLVDRVFTDLRLQLDAEHIQGGAWDFRGDVRGRYQPALCATRIHGLTGEELPCPAAQSGAFGGNELDVRELYVRRRGDATNVSAGRQFALELAAVQFDGVKVERFTTGAWRYLAFAGLYPARISRDIRTDYPSIEPVGDEMQSAGRVTPITAGAGAAYRVEKAYGSLGVVGILPLADDVETGQTEEARVLATSTGYYRHSPKVDLYHFLVLDGAGAAGPGLTNLSLGVNFRPKPSVRTFAEVHRVDTDTLNVHAQRRLEEPNPNEPPATLVQNDITVTRIAQESARAGATFDLRRNRFAVTASAGYRRRGDIEIPLVTGGTFVFPKAQAADVTLRAVDRRSYGGFRFGLSATRSFDVGERNFDHSQALILRGDARRELWDGKGELELDLGFVSVEDEGKGTTCPGQVGNAPDPLQCFGTSDGRTISARSLIHYRLRPDWYLVASGELGTLKLVTNDMTAGRQEQPSVLMLTGFAQIAHRF